MNADELFSGATERLLLRCLSEHDEALYCSLYTDAQTMAAISVPLNMSQARASFASALDANRRALSFPRPGDAGSDKMPWSRRDPFASLPWANRSSPVQSLRIVAESRDLREAVALYGVERWSNTGSDWELGAMVAPGARRRGYALEGMRALCERLLSLCAKRILIRCAPENLSGRRLADRMDFPHRSVSSADSPVMLWARLAKFYGSRLRDNSALQASSIHGENDEQADRIS